MICVYCDSQAVERVKISESIFSTVKGEKVLRQAAQFAPMCDLHKRQTTAHMLHDKQGRITHEKRTVRRKVLAGQTEIGDFL